MSAATYNLRRPEERTTSVVFASPHSGRDYPVAFIRKSVLDEQQIRSSEDVFVDQLFRSAPEFGAPLLTALAPRSYVDLNRAPEELDQALIEGVRRISHNPRVASGLGVIPRVVANGRAIYRGKMTLDEAHHRISHYWRPYHDMLQTLLDESQNKFGEAILIDCHSMPHEALENVGRSWGSVWRDGCVVSYGACRSGDDQCRASCRAEYALCRCVYRAALWSTIARPARDPN